ncbi:MAG: hypothetical protein ACK4P8_10960 [Tabrizicola sp.]
MNEAHETDGLAVRFGSTLASAFEASRGHCLDVAIAGGDRSWRALMICRITGPKLALGVIAVAVAGRLPEIG